MPDIQISSENKHRLLSEHQVWLANLPQARGQIGSEIAMLIEGSPVYIPGEITPYFDFEPVRYLSVDERFIAHLRAVGVPFRED